MLAGTLVQYVVSPDDMRALCAALTATYLVGVVVSLVRPEGGATPAAPATDVPTLADRCAQLAADHALSPRETQILAYLARGRGSTFIGDELCISAQTVKTHTRHIYGKLGVHSREELLDLFGAEDGTPARG